MNLRLITTTLAILTATVALQAQTTERRATMRGGGRPGAGKCTVEVIVDGSARVEIQGDVAYLRNLNGNAPQWRRFECDSIMPPNPLNFRFTGVDGRGSQTLVRDPRNGAAVIQIDDPDNGAQGYTFDITWGGGQEGGGYQSNGGNPNQGYPNSPNGYPNGNNGNYNNGNYNNGNYRNGGYQNGNVRRFTVDQAVQVCQDNIRNQARNQYRTNEVTFRRTVMDDQPGRGDWVVGSVEIRNQGGAPRIARFSCSVNFDNGQVRTAQLEPAHWEGRDQNDGRYNSPAAAIANCQRATENRLRNDGYDRLQFGSARADDQPGRSDWIVGDVRANGRYGSESFRFSCSVDLRDGDVRSVEVTSRR